MLARRTISSSTCRRTAAISAVVGESGAPSAGWSCEESAASVIAYSVKPDGSGVFFSPVKTGCRWRQNSTCRKTAVERPITAQNAWQFVAFAKQS
jgi:hypothetical protein